MPDVVITRPDYEPVTHYLFTWSQQLIELAKANQWNVTDLAENKATLKNFKSAVNNKNPELILLNGHGSYTAITGQNEEIILEAGVNENLLKQTNTYAFSCQTGKELGPSSVKTGAKSYIGYDEDFVFLETKGKDKNPLNDKRAAKFMEPALVVSKSLINRESPNQAYSKSQAAFKKNIEALLSSNSKEAYLVRYLIWDMRHQVCLTA